MSGPNGYTAVMATTKRKPTPDKEGLALLEEMQKKMDGATEEEVLAAVAAYRARREREKATKESKPRRASA